MPWVLLLASCGRGGGDGAASTSRNGLLSGFAVVYANDFDDPAAVGPEWSRRGTAVTPNGARTFLGEFSGNTTSLTLSGLPPHERLSIDVDLLVLKSWDGSSPIFGPDRWRLLVDGGPTLLDTTFSNQTTATDGAANNLQAFGGIAAPPGLYPAFTGASEVSTLGYVVLRKSTGQLVPEDAVYHLRFVIGHTASQVKLVFSGLGLQGVADESWGLDNLVVSVAPGQATAVAAGIGHTCALLADHTVKCWGLGAFGQLGYGNRNNVGDDETPATVGVVDVGGTVKELVAGGMHTCVVLDADTVRCWGLGRDGQLGYGNRNDIGDDETPASAGDVDMGGALIAEEGTFIFDNIALGDFHTCVRTGSLLAPVARCWGLNASGQLGYGNTRNVGDDETPASAGVVGMRGSNEEGIAAGGDHTCSISDSNARIGLCWGLGAFGELGCGNTNTIGDDEPAGATCVIDFSSTTRPLLRQIAAGRFHTCALLSGGEIRCWGNNQSGQLGYGNTNDIGDDETLFGLAPVNVGSAVVQLTAGAFHTCALLGTGAVRCWGDNSFGQLGYGNTNDIGDDETPASAGDVPLGGRAVFIDAGESHTCAVLDTGAVRCWGDNSFGQLGYGNTNDIGDDETPASAGDVRLF